MNLLSDLSSELAVAFLVDKKYSEKVDSKEAIDLIGKVFDILEPISAEAESSNNLHLIKEAKSICH